MEEVQMDIPDQKQTTDQDENRVLDSGAVDDTTYLKQLGYQQELKRVLGLFSSFGVQFTVIAVSGGLFLTFGYGLTTFGPAFIWPWIVAGGLQMVVGLSMADLVSAFPLAGGAYQIANRIARPALAWQIGWWLIMAHIAALAGEAVGLAPYVAGWFGINTLNTWSTLAWTFGLLILVTVVNLIGVRIAALVNNIGVLAELFAMSSVIVILLLFVHRFQPLSILTNTAGTVQSGNPLLPFLLAMLVPAFVISGFDANGSTGEETKNAARTVPRGLVIANFGSYFYGTLGIGIVLLSITNLNGAMGDAFPLIYILKGSVGSVVANVFEVLAVISLFVNMEILELTAARVLWSQARDGQMPASRWLHKLNVNRIPSNATLVSVVIAALMVLWAPILNVLVAMTALAWAVGYGVTIAVGVVGKMRGTLPKHPWHYGRWWPLVDGISLLWSVILCYALIIQNPMQVGLGFVGVVVIGLLIYYVAIPSKRRGVIADISTEAVES
jgi:amino acid transporter